MIIRINHFVIQSLISHQQLQERRREVPHLARADVVVLPHYLLHGRRAELSAVGGNVRQGVNHGAHGPA